MIVKYLLTALRLNFELSLQCVNISRGEKKQTRRRGRSANTSKIYTIMSSPDGKTIAPCTEEQSQFLCFDPPGKGSKIAPHRLEMGQFCNYNSCFKYLIHYSPVRRTIRGFMSHHPGWEYPDSYQEAQKWSQTLDIYQNN